MDPTAEVVHRVGWEQQVFATDLLSGLTSLEMKELEGCFNAKEIHIQDAWSSFFNPLTDFEIIVLNSLSS